MKGIFITFEGIEGCGKTTQLKLLEGCLVAKSLEIVVTREPGGTPMAEAIRGLLLDPAHGALSDMAELLLYEAARAQHVDEQIRPALEAGKIVLCDRFTDSTLAYQGTGRGLARAVLTRLNDIATASLRPDMTILLDLAAAEGIARAANRSQADRIEQESLDFHGRVRQGFLDLAAEEPERVKLIDATQTVHEIGDQVRALVDPLVDSL